MQQMASEGSDPPHDFLLREGLDEIAPFVADLVAAEAERQARKLILIPSESYAPQSVRQALGSVFQNVYAEGYPPLRMTRDPEERLHDVAWQLAYYRRYGDRRFYKGVEYVDLVECLAQRRCARLFAHEGLPAERIFVNVQPLSGAAANLAAYWALMAPGDTLMGLDLFQGGHLTHGSQFNISGRRYRVVSYGVDPATERLNYDQIRDLARQHRPRVIVAGYTSYPWAPDWTAFREIADEVGAYLMADIAHVAGMAAARVYPSPVGIADVTTFTTHKTMCGPRGAVILTTKEETARAIDVAVFPGEQGGPHVNKFAAMAVAFSIADTDSFRTLQRQIVANARSLADALQECGFRLAYSGTDTHLLLIDLKSLPSHTGFPVWGEPAVRILDLAGVVANKNTIPGDTETALATGVRLGTPWVTQRGLDEADMDVLARIIWRVLSRVRPFAYRGLAGILPRGKLPLPVLEEARRDVAGLAEKAGIDFEVRPRAYSYSSPVPDGCTEDSVSLRVVGWRARQFLQGACTANLVTLEPEQSASTYLLNERGRLVGCATVTRESADAWGRERYLVQPEHRHTTQVAAWLQALSDGYIVFDEEDTFRKVEGPVIVEAIPALAEAPVRDARSDRELTAAELFRAHPERFDLRKVYFVGRAHLDAMAPDPVGSEWQWEERESPIQRTPLYDLHRERGAKMVPFAGWEMPIWYSSVGDEHRAVREAAGLFDVAHMGVFEVEGPHATAFLDTVCSNYVAWLEEGQSCYAYLLAPNGAVIDDVMIYRRQSDLYLLVVNASNAAKDWDWLNAVNERRAIIDAARPWVEIGSPATLRNLKDPQSGDRQKRDIALQGPASLATLQALASDAALRETLARIQRTELLECRLAGMDLVVARTGYTGEDLGYEIFVHPDDTAELWCALLAAGTALGVQPAGLGARDSTRTEAGLPLYGHELAGRFDISPIEAGFPGYVKYHKPFFIGRSALLEKEAARLREIIRFRVDERGVRRPQLGDAVVNRKGQIIGHVTSCSLNSDGYLCGMAIVDRRYNPPNTPIAVFTTGGAPLEETLLRSGRVTMPVDATVASRFPLREGRSSETGE
jgi:glycine hydroxymethyltransferase